MPPKTKTITPKTPSALLAEVRSTAAVALRVAKTPDSMHAAIELIAERASSAVLAEPPIIAVLRQDLKRRGTDCSGEGFEITDNDAKMLVAYFGG